MTHGKLTASINERACSHFGTRTRIADKHEGSDDGSCATNTTTRPERKSAA
jgi:hypothetical protein